MLPTKTDVVIIGGGPTGLALAIALQQAGVDYLLIEKLAEGQGTSRAAVLHAHTLDALEGLGVTDQLVARGLKLDRFAIRDRDRELLGLRFAGLPSGHAYLLMLPQDVTEAVLAARLRDLGGRIHRGVTAVAVAETASGVRVDVEDGGAPASISARFVVGADGMRSIVRDRRRDRVRRWHLRRVPSCWRTSRWTGRSAGTRSRCSSRRRGWWWSRRFRAEPSASWRRWRARRSTRTSPMCRRSSTRAVRRRSGRRCGRWCGARGSACITGWRRPTAGGGSC